MEILKLPLPIAIHSTHMFALLALVSDELGTFLFLCLNFFLVQDKISRQFSQLQIDGGIKLRH